MMSKIAMSIWTSVSAPWGIVSSILFTRVPTVCRYVSWYSLRTNRRTREVLPTPPSPMRTSFVFILRTSGIEIQDDSSIRASTISRFVGAYQPMFGIAAVAALTSIGATPLSRSVSTEGAFYLLGIGISTNVDAFIPLARHHRGRHGRRLCRHRVRKRSDTSRRRGDLRRRCRRMDPSGHAGAVERLLRARDIGRIQVPAGQRSEAGHLVVPRDGNHVLLGDHRLVLHLAPEDRDAGLGHVPRSVGDPGPDPERAPNRVEYVHSHLQQPDDGRGARRDRARRQSEAPVLPPRDASPRNHVP